MEAIRASASSDALRDTASANEAEETVLEVEEISLGSKDESKNDESPRLWRFRSGSPVTKSDPLPIVDTVEMMLKLDED